MYYSFALAGHRGTCLRPLHIFAFAFALLLSLRLDRVLNRSLILTQNPV